MCWQVVTPSMVVVSKSFLVNIQIATKTVKGTSLPVISKCNKIRDYSLLSLNGHLYETNTFLCWSMPFFSHITVTESQVSHFFDSL